MNDATLGHVRNLVDRGVRAVLAAPIVSFGRVIGVLALHRAAPTTWMPAEILLAEAVAHETAIAIDTSRLLRESTRQAQVERGFYRIAAVLSEPLSAEATHDAVAQAAAEALGGDSAALLRAVGDELELAGSHELADRLAAYLREEAAALTECARGGKVLASRRLLKDSRFGDGLARAAEAANRRSLLAVPLPESSGHGVGLVLVFFAGEEVFDDEQLALAAQVAGAAAELWSEASCTSENAACGRWRSGSPGPAGSSPASSTPTTCSTRRSAMRCSWWALRAPRFACSKATRSCCGRRSVPVRTT